MRVINRLSTRQLVHSFLVIITVLICISSCKKGGTDTPAPPPAIPDPIINAINPNQGPFNTSVVITGVNFSNVPAENIVKFNGMPATVTNATTTQLTVIVPAGARTGNVSVKVKGAEISGPVFTYEFTGVVTTIAGTPTSGEFQYPAGVAVDAQDNIYVTDMLANNIKKISPTGVVTTFSGAGGQGFLDGSATIAKFNYPWALKLDASGNLYVTDMYNASIRKVSPAGSVTTIAGNGTAGYIDGQGSAARFDHPTGLTFGASGDIYIADSYNFRIRKMTPGGLVSTVIYNPGSTIPEATHGLIVDAAGNIFSCDQTNSRIWSFKTDGTYAVYGFGAGFINGHLTVAKFNGPTDIIADGLGNMYVVDAANCAIRKIDANGYVSTFAGGTCGYADGTGTAAKFQSPTGIAIDKDGNLIIADATNHVIRKIVIR
jgi:sugar lactone lactonase YvrE